jgi:hypothetical protein
LYMYMDMYGVEYDVLQYIVEGTCRHTEQLQAHCLRVLLVP